MNSFSLQSHFFPFQKANIDLSLTGNSDCQNFCTAKIIDPFIIFIFPSFMNWNPPLSQKNSWYYFLAFKSPHLDLLFENIRWILDLYLHRLLESIVPIVVYVSHLLVGFGWTPLNVLPSLVVVSLCVMELCPFTGASMKILLLFMELSTLYRKPHYALHKSYNN